MTCCFYHASAQLTNWAGGAGRCLVQGGAGTVSRLCPTRSQCQPSMARHGTVVAVTTGRARACRVIARTLFFSVEILKKTCGSNSEKCCIVLKTFPSTHFSRL
ncbi:hypothetical protein RRG08_020956 [Elysia crispata]|uniref:Uncharacterized protein n=1 Tax=Elysia crispata TaxID=231223 RepID=A0AAE0YLB8_9GAST|nr:hypothetical protein RRG08_020956 [Elysia crispata]